MTSEPGHDEPWEQAEAEIALTGRGVSVGSHVDRVLDGVVLARPSLKESLPQVVVQVGDAVEILWKSQGTRRVAPAEVVEVSDGGVARWHMRITGPAETTQRRNAVRGRAVVEVEMTYRKADVDHDFADVKEDTTVADVDEDTTVADERADVEATPGDAVESTTAGGAVTMRGSTVDLSETGMRVAFTGSSDKPPKAGSTLALEFEVDDGPVRTTAELIRNQIEGSRWLMSLRFDSMAEKDQDRVRRRVFRALREERAREVG